MIYNNEKNRLIHLKYFFSFVLVFGINTTTAKDWSKLNQQDYIDNLFSCQLQIKELEWSHTIWPKANKALKPLFKHRINEEEISYKILSSLTKESILFNELGFQLTHEMLQNELNRIANKTQSPYRLQEYFDLLDNNANSIIECLVKPNLINKQYQKIFQNGQSSYKRKLHGYKQKIYLPSYGGLAFTLPKISHNNKTFTPENFLGLTDTWTGINDVDAPVARMNHTAVWTGSKMIVWGGDIGSPTGRFKSGGLYDPALDSWTATREDTAPSARNDHTAVWSGTYMIIWGGHDGTNPVNTGSRYDPLNDSWSVTSASNLIPRLLHTAVWTGSKMIVWGGFGGNGLRDGGIYDPDSNTWSLTQQTGAPSLRYYHTAVWAEDVMVVWGGFNGSTNLNTGGVYSLTNNSWSDTSITGMVPSARNRHSATWTGQQMVIWGGSFVSGGGRYDVTGNSWLSLVTVNGPAENQWHSSLWTGTEVIIWGGLDKLNTGSRYNEIDDAWQLVTTTNAPSGRDRHTAIWTGSSMIVWGGTTLTGYTNTGSTYFSSSSYTIGVSVIGLIGTNPMIIQYNNSNDLNINMDGNYIFSSPLLDGVSYQISISVLPNSPMQNCGIANGSGTINGVNVSDILIDCSDRIFQDGFENIL